MKKNRILFTALLAVLFISMLNFSNEAYSHCLNDRHHKSVKYHHNLKTPFYAQAQIRIHTPLGSFYSGGYGLSPLVHPIAPIPRAFNHTNVVNIYL